MNIFKLFLFLLISPLVFTSCETSQTPVDELSSLLEKIDNNSENYSEEDWNNITNEFIHTLKEEELNSLENSIKSSWVGVLFLFLFEWLYTKYIRKFMIISEWKRRKRLRGKK